MSQTSVVNAIKESRAKGAVQITISDIRAGIAVKFGPGAVAAAY